MNKIKNHKKAQAMQFAWIFSVIVGALFLFLAFYFVGTTLLRQNYEQSTIQAQSMDILMNPFSYLGSIGATTYKPLELSKKSEINLECSLSSSSDLGYNKITIKGEKEKEFGVPKTVYDKYIFSQKIIEGKKFNALSKPFKMPWRVADIIIIWPYDEKYCFINARSDIKDELSNDSSTSLNVTNIFFKKYSRSCPPDSIKVCFSGSGSCDIKVNRDPSQKSVEKKGKTVYYIGDNNALLYAAIFSDSNIYNCNLKRLASRLSHEIDVYSIKARDLSSRHCRDSFDLQSLKSTAGSIKKNTGTITKGQLSSLENAAQTLERENNIADCSLF